MSRDLSQIEQTNGQPPIVEQESLGKDDEAETATQRFIRLLSQASGNNIYILII